MSAPWPSTFHKSGPELNHYVIAALMPVEGPGKKGGGVLKIELAIGADTRERYIRSSYFDDLLTEEQLSIWPKRLLAAVREAIDGAERFTPHSLVDRYMPPPGSRRAD